MIQQTVAYTPSTLCFPEPA